MTVPFATVEKPVTASVIAGDDGVVRVFPKTGDETHAVLPVLIADLRRRRVNDD